MPAHSHSSISPVFSHIFDLNKGRFYTKHNKHIYLLIFIVYILASKTEDYLPYVTVYCLLFRHFHINETLIYSLDTCLWMWSWHHTVWWRFMAVVRLDRLKPTADYICFSCVYRVITFFICKYIFIRLQVQIFVGEIDQFVWTWWDYVIMLRRWTSTSDIHHNNDLWFCFSFLWIVWKHSLALAENTYSPVSRLSRRDACFSPIRTT